MKIIDPHIDIASIYDEFNIPLQDFFSGRGDIPVSLQMLKDTETRIVGFSLFIDPNLTKTSMFDGVMEYYDFYKKLTDKTDELVQIKSALDMKNISQDKIGFFYSIEGLECVRDEKDLKTFYNLGVRSFGLTWENGNKYATGNGEVNDLGIKPKGKSLLKRMKGYRLMVDTAHLSARSFVDLYESFDGVIINTHANVKKFADSRHNLSDHQIQMIADRDGLVCVFPVADEVGGNKTFDDWYKHVDYIASKWGIERVGLCSDIFPLPEYPFIKNAQNMKIIKEFQKYLLTRLDKKTVKKISHDNFFDLLMRVL